ncbi:serine/threonine protein kinase, CMGC, CDC2/CDK sub [Boothiomyces macroporosus]|uniref:Serine/threonine protein kinase, CMGC, CDC2/CDK sub n=1 Tax=Boothiomyces macroporosus TaxID=261099 RepID=A0AAD5UDF3_9FUNG|nr:serine/threonine protein kinase, CMGC, CDC2/CDK sub [Boothiomyces macroporosus]
MESEREQHSSQDSLEELPEIPHAPLHPSQIESHNNTPVQTPAHIVVEEGEVVDSEDKEFTGVSPISEYEIENKLGEGTFGEVLLATHSKTGLRVALKKILTHNDKEGFPVTSLREIKLLKSIDHENIIDLMEIAIEKGDPKRNLHATIYMVFPYMDHDLAGLLGNPSVTLTTAQLKSYTQQILRGIKHLHDNDIIHRDMKGANILVDNCGRVKLADFGLARTINHTMTTTVVTLWYRPPELLLQGGNSYCKYTTAVDMWGVGCIFGELLKRRPILPGANEMDQLKKIFELLGSPTAQNWPGYSDLPLVKDGKVTDFGVKESTLSTKFNSSSYSNETYNLLYNLLRLDPTKRLSASEALKHEYFKVSPYPAKPGTRDFQAFPKSHELDVRQMAKVELPPHCDYKNRDHSRNYNRRNDYDRDRDRDRNDRNGHRRDDERPRRDHDDRRSSRRDERNDASQRDDRRFDERRNDDRSKDDDRDKSFRSDRNRNDDRYDRGRNADRGYDHERPREDRRRDNDNRRSDRFNPDRRRSPYNKRSPVRSRDNTPERRRRSPDRKDTIEKNDSVQNSVHSLMESSQHSAAQDSERNGRRRDSDRKSVDNTESEKKDDESRKRKSPEHDRDDGHRKKSQDRRDSMRDRRSNSFKKSPRGNSRDDDAK